MHASPRRLLYVQYSLCGDHVAGQAPRPFIVPGSGARSQLARVRNLYQDLLIPVPYLSFLRATFLFPAALFSSLSYFTFVEDGTITR
jgi:hypothetical protein